MTNNETFTRGEWVEVSSRNSPLESYIWKKAIFLAKIEGSDRGVFCVEEGCEDSFLEGRNIDWKAWELIRKIPQPQKPKKTVLKAPRITKSAIFDGTVTLNYISTELFENEEQARQRLCGSELVSFPAKIRMKDGTDQELWFPVDEE